MRGVKELNERTLNYTQKSWEIEVYFKYVSASCTATGNKHSPRFLVILRMPPSPEDETTGERQIWKGSRDVEGLAAAAAAITSVLSSVREEKPLQFISQTAQEVRE